MKENPAAIEPGPLVNAIIFVKNLSPKDMKIKEGMENDKWLRAVVETYGQVTKLDLLDSKLASRRVAGFIEMPSEAWWKS
eukprot:6607247-Prymnesium_polylepis.1